MAGASAGIFKISFDGMDGTARSLVSFTNQVWTCMAALDRQFVNAYSEWHSLPGGAADAFLDARERLLDHLEVLCDWVDELGECVATHGEAVAVCDNMVDRRAANA
jgi:hypothetical protein